MCLCDWELKGEWDRERASRISQPLKRYVGECHPMQWLGEGNMSTFCYQMTLQSDAPVWRQFSVTPESSVHKQSVWDGINLQRSSLKSKMDLKILLYYWIFRPGLPIDKQEWTMFQDRAGSPISIGTAFPWGTEDLKSDLFNFTLKCEIQFKYVC